MEERKYIAKGNPKDICLQFHRQGIGDAIQSMPVVWQKKQDGYNITVRCPEFVRPLYEVLGVSVEVVSDNDIQSGDVYWLIKNESKYGAIYSLNNWSIDGIRQNGLLKESYMKSLAEILETSVPEFDWTQYLKPTASYSFKYIILSLRATYYWRAYPRIEELFNKLSKSVTVMLLGHPSSTHLDADYYFSYQRFRNIFRKYKNRNSDNASQMFPKFQDLIDVVCSANGIITTDTGVLHLAIVLRKKATAIFGMTSAEEFKKNYPSELLENITFIQGEHNSCHSCYGQEEKGFRKDRCKGIYGKPKCLSSVSPDELIKHLQLT